MINICILNVRYTAYLITALPLVRPKSLSNVLDNCSIPTISLCMYTITGTLGTFLISTGHTFSIMVHSESETVMKLICVCVCRQHLSSLSHWHNQFDMTIDFCLVLSIFSSEQSLQYKSNVN